MRNFWIVLVWALVLGACSTFNTRTPEQIVADRAQKRVDALMAGDYEGSYQYTTPSYRSTEGVGRYGTRWAGVAMWLSADVAKVECSGVDPVNRCSAVVEVVYKAARYEPMTTSLSEDWLLVNGSWFLYQNLGE